MHKAHVLWECCGTQQGDARFFLSASWETRESSAQCSFPYEGAQKA